MRTRLLHLQARLIQHSSYVLLRRVSATVHCGSCPDQYRFGGGQTPPVRHESAQQGTGLSYALHHPGKLLPPRRLGRHRIQGSPQRLQRTWAAKQPPECRLHVATDIGDL